MRSGKCKKGFNKSCLSSHQGLKGPLLSHLSLFSFLWAYCMSSCCCSMGLHNHSSLISAQECSALAQLASQSNLSTNCNCTQQLINNQPIFAALWQVYTVSDTAILCKVRAWRQRTSEQALLAGRRWSKINSFKLQTLLLLASYGLVHP